MRQPASIERPGEPDNRPFYRAFAHRLRRNARGYLEDCRLLLVAFLIAAVLDLFTTMRFMLADGAETEFHPAIRLVSWLFGPIWGPVVGKLCQFAAALLITIYFRRYAKIILAITTFLYAWAAWYNVWGKSLYVPRLMNFFAG